MSKWEIIAAALALVAGVWEHVQALIRWFYGLVVVTRRTEFSLGSVLLRYLDETSKSVRGADDAYGSDLDYVRSLDRSHRVIYRSLFGAARLYWKGARPLWFKPMLDDETAGDCRMVFSFVRGTFDWERMLLAAADWEAATNHKRPRHRVHFHFGVTTTSALAADDDDDDESSTFKPVWDASRGVRILKWDRDEIGGGAVKCSMPELSLRPELTRLTAEIKFWYESRAWYRERGIPWRRGFVFHGAPGTGKTSYVRALAEQLDMPVHVFDLATMRNECLRKAWSKMTKDAPCVALLEDIDAVFDGRDNVSGGELTFDCLLNCIDGVERADGVLLVITTNYLEALDEALAHREGRVDRLVEFLPLDYEGRFKLARRVLRDDGVAERLALEHEDVSATQFQEICFRTALAAREGERTHSTEPYR